MTLNICRDPSSYSLPACFARKRHHSTITHSFMPATLVFCSEGVPHNTMRLFDLVHRTFEGLTFASSPVII
jgi:hypothetical protein